MPDASVTFSGEAIPLLILFVPHQKPSRGGLWHPILMQFYSGPLMHLLSGVDTGLSSRAIASRIVVLPTSPPPRITLTPRTGRHWSEGIPRYRSMESS